MRAGWTFFVMCCLGAVAARAEEIDRTAIADFIYRDCNGEESVLLSDGEMSMPFSSPQRESFCRCVGDYMSELMDENEIRYVATYLAPTPPLLEKEQRAKELCRTMVAP